MKHTILILLLSCVSLSLYAQTIEEQPTYTYVTEAEHFKPQKLILPGALIALGAWGVENGWLRHIDRKVNKGMQDLSGGKTTSLDGYLRFAPLVGSIALYKFGAPTAYNLKERLAVRVTSYLAYFALVGGTKQIVNEMRPDGSENNSFPSGHTTVAFMGAEHIRTEYGGWYGVGAYAVATSVAFLRLYNQKHWLNDVIAGAGAGILCARLGYWLLPLERKVFNLSSDPSEASMVAMPLYDSSTKAVGCALAYQF